MLAALAWTGSAGGGGRGGRGRRLFRCPRRQVRALRGRQTSEARGTTLCPGAQATGIDGALDGAAGVVAADRAGCVIGPGGEGGLVCGSVCCRRSLCAVIHCLCAAEISLSLAQRPGQASRRGNKAPIVGHTTLKSCSSHTRRRQGAQEIMTCSARRRCHERRSKRATAC